MSKTTAAEILATRREQSTRSIEMCKDFQELCRNQVNYSAGKVE